MPIWVKCILMLWVVRYVMTLFVKTHVEADADGIAEKIARAEVTKQYKDIPVYLLIFGSTVIITRLSIIPLAVWFIFLR